MNYSLMWNGQPSGLTFEQTLDQNEHEGGVDVGEIEAERRNEETGVDAEGREVEGRLMLLMNLNLPGLRKR